VCLAGHGLCTKAANIKAARCVQCKVAPFQHTVWAVSALQEVQALIGQLTQPSSSANSSNSWYVLQRPGPSSFVVGQDPGGDKFKVALGNQPTCSCRWALRACSCLQETAPAFWRQNCVVDMCSLQDWHGDSPCSTCATSGTGKHPKPFRTTSDPCKSCKALHHL
jgi:hypothetical protein